jgi:uncharacterized membrane protein YeiH
MRGEGALLAGVAAFGVLFISSLGLVGGFLRNFLAPSAPPFLTPFLTFLLILGFSVSVPTLWVVKKHWKKFERGGFRYYATLRDVSEAKKKEKK